MTTDFANPHASLTDHVADLLEAGRLRDEGMARVEQNADPRLVLMIDTKIAEFNATGRSWSTNDVRDLFPVTAGQLVGARVRAASMRRPAEMECVGRTPSTLRSTHGHEIKVWRGVRA